MKCLDPECQAEYPDDNNYCGKCGVLLRTNPTREEIVLAIKDVTRDREVLEKEVAHAIIERTWSYFKIFASIVGMLSVVATIIFGYRIYRLNDTGNRANKTLSFNAKRANSQIDNIVAAARRNATQIQQVTESTTATQQELQITKQQLDKLRGQFSDSMEQLGKLRDQFNDSEELVGQNLTSLIESIQPQKSDERPSLKYRLPPTDSMPSNVLNVDQLFTWKPVGISDGGKIVEISDAEWAKTDKAVDERENWVIEITGIARAVQLDGDTLSIRVAHSEPKSFDQMILIVVPSPKLAVSDKYAAARAAILNLISKRLADLRVGPDWTQLDNHVAITATGYALFNPHYKRRKILLTRMSRLKLGNGS